jgi:hypothetical protein
MNHVLRSLLACVVAAILGTSQNAEACGCFAPPSTVEPIVQAGERILFSVKDGKVTAHIQIQYSGEAKDFGWLLPLPSVPTLKLGSDELFTRLGATTQPQYVTTQTLGQPCAQPSGGFAFGCAAPRSALFSEPTSGGLQDAGTSTPLVTASSISPYDFAVLKADDKTAMFQWLSDNRFFVPTGTDDAVGPYIRPGAYFLALKLKAGARSGDVTPVVVEYPSQLPMIPLILTSVGATPNMGVQVYLLGEGRGIPRNFHHVVLNDARLDWVNGATNYSALITAAVAEAPQKHAFITEYAGSSEVMVDQLAPPGRFGTEQELAAATTPQDFVAKLYAKRFGFDNAAQSRALPSPVVRLLLTDIPYPSGLAARGVNESDFINNVEYYLGTYRSQNPDVFVGYMTNFDAPSLAQQIFEQYVTPMREANALFAQHPKLTRLITTLSPEDMTEDPVFSFNPALPDVIPVHAGKIVMNCGDSDVETAQGFKLQNVSSSQQRVKELPAALRIETLSEEGQAVVVTDNTDAITTQLNPAAMTNMNADPKTGCSTVDPMTLGLLVMMWLRRRKAKE